MRVLLMVCLLCMLLRLIIRRLWRCLWCMMPWLDDDDVLYDSKPSSCGGILTQWNTNSFNMKLMAICIVYPTIAAN